MTAIRELFATAARLVTTHPGKRARRPAVRRPLASASPVRRHPYSPKDTAA